MIIENYLNNKISEIIKATKSLQLEILGRNIEFDLKNKKLSKRDIILLDKVKSILNSKKSRLKPKVKPVAERYISKGEYLVKSYLDKNNIKYESEKEFPDMKGDYGNLRLDFYLPDHKIAIEYDGEQHFKYIEEFDKGDVSLVDKRQRYDAIKDEYCYLNGIQIIRISHFQIEKIYKILEAILFRTKSKEVIKSVNTSTKGNTKNDLKYVMKGIRKDANKAKTFKELDSLRIKTLYFRKGLKGNLLGMNTHLLNHITSLLKKYK